MISEKPRMAFSGVRSSWLILARKADLARLASCACSAATARRRDMILQFGAAVRQLRDDPARIKDQRHRDQHELSSSDVDQTEPA